jgi:hypothetical protein
MKGNKKEGIPRKMIRVNWTDEYEAKYTGVCTTVESLSAFIIYFRA